MVGRLPQAPTPPRRLQRPCSVAFYSSEEEGVRKYRDGQNTTPLRSIMAGPSQYKFNDAEDPNDAGALRNGLSL